jgi:cytosine/adenosine deaminase-related metal-dependent hydrolase
VIPGISFHQELALLAEAGIPPRDILRIATHNGAEALGILGDAGTLEPGKRADVIVLSADPLADIRNTRGIEKVMQGGGWVSRLIVNLIDNQPGTSQHGPHADPADGPGHHRTAHPGVPDRRGHWSAPVGEDDSRADHVL